MTIKKSFSDSLPGVKTPYSPAAPTRSPEPVLDDLAIKRAFPEVVKKVGELYAAGKLKEATLLLQSCQLRFRFGDYCEGGHISARDFNQIAGNAFSTCLKKYKKP